MSLRMSLTCPITCPFTTFYVSLYESHTSPTPYVPYVSRTCPVRVPYVSCTCPVPPLILVLVLFTPPEYTYPRTHMHHNQFHLDRASFDKETARFIGNWWGQKDSVAARIKAEWKKTSRNGTGDTEEGAAATAEA